MRPIPLIKLQTILPPRKKNNYGLNGKDAMLNRPSLLIVGAGRVGKTLGYLLTQQDLVLFVAIPSGERERESERVSFPDTLSFSLLGVGGW